MTETVPLLDAKAAVLLVLPASGSGGEGCIPLILRIATGLR